MDERARQQIIEKAFDVLDHADAQQAIWEIERQTESFDAKFARQEADAYLAKLQRRRLEQTEPQGLPAVGKPQPKVQPGMTDDDRRWVCEALEMLAGVIGEGVGKTQTDIVRKLREEIGQLRAEITLLQAHKMAKPDVSVEGSIMSLRNRRVA